MCSSESNFPLKCKLLDEMSGHPWWFLTRPCLLTGSCFKSCWILDSGKSHYCSVNCTLLIWKQAATFRNKSHKIKCACLVGGGISNSGKSHYCSVCCTLLIWKQAATIRNNSHKIKCACLVGGGILSRHEWNSSSSLDVPEWRGEFCLSLIWPNQVYKLLCYKHVM